MNRRAQRLRLRFKRLFILTAFVALAMLAGQPASAQFIVQSHTVQALSFCEDQHFYNSQTANPPPVVARSFRGRGAAVTFRVCADVDGNTHYFIRKPRPNRNGICRIFENELFPGDEQDMQIVDVLYDGTTLDWYFTMTGWKSWPPEDWEKLHYRPQSQILALDSDRACPRGDDKRYIPVGSMTDGMLNGFFKLWHRVSSSPEAFDKEFANTTSIANLGLGFKEDHAALVRQLRDDLFQEGRARPTLSDLNCEIGSLPGCEAFFERFVVGFDSSDQGITLTRIDPVLVP